MLKRDLYWYGLHWGGWLVVFIAAVVVAVSLIVVLLRDERKLVPQRVGYTLLVLRLLVIGVLFLALLEPVLSWTLDREQTGRILVAVDLSQSMETRDRHATKAEKLRWARGLGMIGNPNIDDRLDRWLEAFEGGREPAWVDKTETDDPQRRRQLAEAREQNLNDVFAEVDLLSRKEIAQRLLSGTASPLLTRLDDVFNVELAVFAGKSETVDVQMLEKLILHPPTSVLTSVSDLGRALQRVPAGAAASNGTDPAGTADGSLPLIGVVLFTDGRDNAGKDTLGAAARLGQHSVPVVPVLLGSQRRPKDLAIAALEHPQTVFKNDKPVLKVTLSTAGFAGEPLEIVLRKKGNDEPVTKTITPESDTAGVEFELDAAELGRHEYTILATPKPGEVRDDNNRKAFALNVVDDTVKVLLIEGEARWEFRFLDGALERDERVDVERVVFRQPYLGVLSENFFPRSLSLPEDANDLENSPFAEQDLVILGDVAPEEIPHLGWELLEKFVTESGGTLVFIAGKEYFPLAYDSEIVDRLLPLTKLRPISVTGRDAMSAPTERGFHWQLTPEGESEPMFEFDADPARNKKIWSGLPGHLWGLLGEAKPGASVLAHAILPHAGADLPEQRQHALIVHQHYGFGQVLWIGIDSTWRWRHRVGDAYHHRFWGQMSRWAAQNKASAGNESVKFGTDAGDVEVGEDVVIRARWTRRFLQKFPDFKSTARIDRISPLTNSPPFQGGAASVAQPFATIELNPVPNQPLIHEGRLVSLPAGEYRLRLEVENADLGPDAIVAPLFVREKQTLELSDLRANRTLLAQLAEVSQGRLFFPDELDELPEMFQDSGLASTTRHEFELWDHPVVLLVFFTLMMIEWVVRKLNGLP